MGKVCIVGVSKVMVIDQAGETAIRGIARDGARFWASFPIMGSIIDLVCQANLEMLREGSREFRSIVFCRACSKCNAIENMMPDSVTFVLSIAFVCIEAPFPEAAQQLSAPNSVSGQDIRSLGGPDKWLRFLIIMFRHKHAAAKCWSVSSRKKRSTMNKGERFPQPQLLRLSVTDRCNFRCLYCMPSEGIPRHCHKDLLSLEELGAIAARLSAHVGIQRIKLTGGEPLVRKGIEHLVSQLAQSAGLHELSMTTNGSLLASRAASLKSAGLARVNVSLDSLDPFRFSRLTHGGQLTDTLRGINQACAVGLTPLKLNAVLQRSTWKMEVPELLSFAATNHLEIRFIELMRTGTERMWCESEFVAIEVVQSWLQERGQVVELYSPEVGPSRRTLVTWLGREIEVGWIAPRSRPFCASCVRLRLDASGLLRRCLMDPSTLDLRSIARSQLTCDAISRLHAYLDGKVRPYAMDNMASMSVIGG